jgi:predicted TIM-barrel fold metal-dependent hydrolase
VHRRSGSTGPSPLDVVKQVLSESGFAGAKLYPPMGFRPWNNAGITDGFGPTAEKVAPRLQGQELDDELAALYTFCAQNDVPILAHCSNSQTSFEGAGERAAPQYWEQLLSNPQYRNLRVNLGHFGSLWCADSNRTPGSDEDMRCQVAKSWPAYILGMLQPDASGNLRFPNLYFDLADIGDFTQPIYRVQLMDYLKRYLPADSLARGKVLSHMLYGTDWMFLAMDPGLTDFAAAMENLAQDPAIGLAADDFLWRNALRFLGLSESARTTARLRSFYKDDAKHLALLNQLVLNA